MGRVFKVFVGLLLLIGGVYWYTQNVFLGTTVSNWEAFLYLFKGGFGFFLFLVGLILTWIEIDEMRLEQELEEQHLQQDTEKTKESTRNTGRVDAEEKKDEYYDKERVDEPDIATEESDAHTCEECGRSFDSERGLHIHQSRSH